MLGIRVMTDRTAQILIIINFSLIIAGDAGIFVIIIIIIIIIII
jgi:hypothetical protein